MTANKDFLEFSSSVDVDKVMLIDDIWGSEAHALMLWKQGIIDIKTVKGLLRSLKKVEKAAKAGKFELKKELEDVHMNVEAFISKDVGDAIGGKLHTARSRNDQVLVDAKMHLRKGLLAIEVGIVNLEQELLDIAKKHKKTIMPGFTHTQHAQPISLGFWATAHANMLMRDLERLQGCYKRVNQCPLGACALAGTSLPIDREFTANLLGFDGVQKNALDIVSSRDFVIEALSCLAILSSNLSRLAEDLVIWSNPEFGFIVLDDAYCSGSSIMPQKKNPDAAELVRGRVGHVYGALVNILTLTKGLPMGYNRDFQEDKLPLWFAVSTVKASLKMMAGMIGTMEVNEDKMKASAMAGFAGATALANHLVVKHKLPFRKSHGVVKEAVKELSSGPDGQKDFSDLGLLAKMLNEKKVEVGEEELKHVLSAEGILEAQSSMGGTSPHEVDWMASELAVKLDKKNSTIKARAKKINAAKKLTEKVVDEVISKGKCSIF